MLLNLRILNCVLTVGLVSSALGEPPDKARYMSASDREQAGIQPPTWNVAGGKADPSLLQKIQQEEILRRSPNFNEATHIVDGCPGGFAEEVHVIVHLAPGNISEVQSAVLDTLTSADFQLEYSFQRSPAMMGWVGREGLEKLVQHDKVVAISFDNTRLKKNFRISTRPLEQRPTSQPTKVESAVYEELRTSAFVHVMVYLERRSLPPGDIKQAFASLQTEMSNLEKQVLKGVGATHFRVSCRLAPTPVISGDIDVLGVEALRQSPLVRWIELERGGRGS